VSALAVSGGDLYAGGNLTSAGGTNANNIAKWNGSSWSALGSGIGKPPSDSSSVNALAVLGSDLYAGGYFTTAGGIPANCIARWNGAGWTALGARSGINGPVSALLASGSELYAGGNFTGAGSIVASNIAKWNGSNWTNLGAGLAGSAFGGRVYALALSGGNLYVGGDFTTAGATAATNVARWDGTSWSAVGSGLGDSVHALALSGGDLYAACDWRIAKWNGSSWSDLGGLQSSASYSLASARALAVSGSDLYAGGSFVSVFPSAGGGAAANIAKWNGSTWTALGSGMAGPFGSASVSALAVSGSNLYVGGYFTTAGGNPATNIAKWDGNAWSALGSGLNGGVSALAVSGNDLYAAGGFTTAGGTPASYIAKWDGNSWTALASGMDGQGQTLAISGSDLYVGGGFTTAGGKASLNWAKAIINPPVLAIEPDGFGGYFLSFDGVPGSAYRLQRAQALIGPWATSSAQPAPASGRLEFWDIFPPPGQAFYRSVGP
jgi:hypothetical protein